MRKTFLSIILIITSISVSAQGADVEVLAPKPFSYLDVSVTAGTTGIGIELATPLTSWLSVRAGASTTPRINFPGDYTLQVGEKAEKPSYDKDGNLKPTKFEKIQELMFGLTGTMIDKTVRMNRKPTIDNVKFLLDIRPLKNKHWYATVGCYYGSSKVAYAQNDILECPSLTGVVMYNNMYRMAVNDIPITIGYDDIYMSSDIAKRFKSYGRMGVPMGKFTSDIMDEESNEVLHEKGSTFLLEPDGDNLVQAECYVNRFRPFVGIGYEGAISKKNKHWLIGTNLGVMYWGTPKVITKRKEQTTTYDNEAMKYVTTNHYYDIDLAADVEDLPKTVKRQVDFFKSLPVYPVAELKISYRIF